MRNLETLTLTASTLLHALLMLASQMGCGNEGMWVHNKLPSTLHLSSSLTLKFLMNQEFPFFPKRICLQDVLSYWCWKVIPFHRRLATSVRNMILAPRHTQLYTSIYPRFKRHFMLIQVTHRLNGQHAGNQLKKVLHAFDCIRTFGFQRASPEEHWWLKTSGALANRICVY